MKPELIKCIFIRKIHNLKIAINDNRHKKYANVQVSNKIQIAINENRSKWKEMKD